MTMMAKKNAQGMSKMMSKGGMMPKGGKGSMMSGDTLLSSGKTVSNLHDHQLKEGQKMGFSKHS